MLTARPDKPCGCTSRPLAARRGCGQRHHSPALGPRCYPRCMPSTPALRAALLLAALAALAACGGGTIGSDPGAEVPPVTPDDPVAAAVLAAHNTARAAATPAPS